LEATAEAAAFLTGTGPLEAKVDLTPGFLEAAAEGAGAVLEDRGFLDANGEALDEVVVAADAGLDVAALRADAAAVVRLASGAREAVGAGLVDEDAVEAAGFVVVLADRGALAVVVPLVLAEVVVLAGEAVRADAVDLTAVVGAAFLSARPGRVVAPGVGLFWVMGDALAAVGAGLDEGPVRVDPVGPLPAVVLGAVGLDVAVAEPVAGLVGLVAAVDAAVLLAGVALLVSFYRKRFLFQQLEMVSVIHERIGALRAKASAVLTTNVLAWFAEQFLNVMPWGFASMVFAQIHLNLRDQVVMTTMQVLQMICAKLGYVKETPVQHLVFLFYWMLLLEVGGVPQKFSIQTL